MLPNASRSAGIWGITSAIRTALPKCKPAAPVDNMDFTSGTVLPQLWSMTIKLPSWTASTICFTYFEENSSQSEGPTRPAAGSAIIKPFAPVALIALAYSTRKRVVFPKRAWTISGSLLIFRSRFFISSNLPVRENGPIRPPKTGLFLICRAASSVAFK